MKPLNLDNRPCSPISSNCVIWQGPDIPCITLCTGDTVSDVIFKLATELCTIMDTLKITNYDLSCFNLAACPPQTFQELIQFLIEQICTSQGLDTTRVAAVTESTCPDCVVSVASCFVVGRQTTMQLVDYVNMIGERICNIIDQISLINTQLTSILIRVEALENAPAPVTPTPTIIINCDIGTLSSGNSYTIDTVLNELLNNTSNGYCTLLSVLGTPASIGDALVPACSFGTDVTTDPNWTATPTTLAESLTNAWIVLCDVYAAVSTGLVNTDNTSSVSLDLTAGVLTANIQDTGWVDLNGFAWYGTYNITNKRVPQCRRIGNAVHFRGVVMIPLQDPSNGNQPLIWDYNGSAPLTDTYFLNTTVTPSTGGPGSVVLNNGGSITFNQGNGIIPTTIVDSGTNFDNSYTLSYKPAFRFVRIDASPLYSGALTTLLKPIITSDKKLVLALIKDFEETAGTGGTVGNPYSTSVINNVISHVRTGEYVPQYQSATSVMASSPASGVQNVVLDYDATLTYTFDCDANDETNLGGFGWVDLDGLIAYLDPCTTDIKNYSCP
jgi:hypothetical protein